MNDRAGQPFRGPILSETVWEGRLPPPRAHVAIVIVYRNGDHEEMWPRARQRVPLSRRPTTLYEIDLSLQQADFEADVPSRTDACPFFANIAIQWRVTNPSAIVRHRVTDVAAILAPHVLHRIRGITRNYEITESATAEDKINDQLGGVVATPSQAPPDEQATTTSGLGAEYGLWTRIIAQLSLDEAATEHKAKMARLNWAIEEEKAEQELRLLQEQHQQRITADRMDVYRQIIAAGDIERFALQLADNPSDVAAIEKIMREEQRNSRRDTIEFVAHMVDSGVIERWQVNDEVKEALAWLKEATTRVIPEMKDDSWPGSRERRRGRVIVAKEDSDSEFGQRTSNGQAAYSKQDGEKGSSDPETTPPL